MASTTSATMRPTLTGSELASTRARTTCGRPRPAAATSSRVRARSICPRIENGVSRPISIRSVDVTTPMIEPSGPVTGEWCTPSANIDSNASRDQRVLGQRLDGERRDLLDGCLRAPMRREHARPQVAVGHDAPPLAHRDEQTGDVFRCHPLGGGRHAHPGVRGDRGAADQPADGAEREPRRRPSPRARRRAAPASCPRRTTAPRTCPGSRRRRRRRSGSRACPRAHVRSTSGSRRPATRTARTPRRRSGGRRACPPRSARRRPCGPRRGSAPARPIAPGSRRPPGSARSRPRLATRASSSGASASNGGYRERNVATSTARVCRGWGTVRSREVARRPRLHRVDVGLRQL